ncbi:MAG TPA: acetylglutamate kinase, partial [Rhodothermales bacterium]|nr:acetylglutamate kinase [Rhodothermales bacterium]
LLKVGGTLVADPDTRAALWRGVVALRSTTDVVIVHGGGPQSTALARRLGHEPRMVAGRRVTTDLDLDVAKYTLRGAASADLVSSACASGVPAVGVAGLDGGLVRVTRRPPWIVDGETVDFGHVGDVEGVEPRLVRVLLEARFVPVVCPLAADASGQVLNVNADTVALALALVLGAARLLLVTDSGGVRRDASDAATLLPELSREAYEAGVEEGWISGGMRPKLEGAFSAHEAGVPVVLLGLDDLGTPERGTRIV